jgi:hypothetical protein
MMFVFIEHLQKLGLIRAFFMSFQLMILKSFLVTKLLKLSVLCLVFLHKQDVFLSAKIGLGTRPVDRGTIFYDDQYLDIFRLLWPSL